MDFIFTRLTAFQVGDAKSQRQRHRWSRWLAFDLLSANTLPVLAMLRLGNSVVRLNPKVRQVIGLVPAQTVQLKTILFQAVFFFICYKLCVCVCM